MWLSQTWLLNSYAVAGVWLAAPALPLPHLVLYFIWTRDIPTLVLSDTDGHHRWWIVGRYKVSNIYNTSIFIQTNQYWKEDLKKSLTPLGQIPKLLIEHYIKYMTMSLWDPMSIFRKKWQQIRSKYWVKIFHQRWLLLSDIVSPNSTCFCCFAQWPNMRSYN